MYVAPESKVLFALANVAATSPSQPGDELPPDEIPEE